MRKLDGIITERGWVKHIFVVGTKFCLSQALSNALMDHETYIAVAEVAKSLFPERVDSTFMVRAQITMFNDHPATVFADIEKVLKVAEERLEFEK